MVWLLLLLAAGVGAKKKTTKKKKKSGSKELERAFVGAAAGAIDRWAGPHYTQRDTVNPETGKAWGW